MPFTFKLSQRLARMRRAALLCTTAALAACEKPGVAGPSEPGSQVVKLIVSPDSITLTPSQSEQFVAFGRTPAGDSVPVACCRTISAWKATFAFSRAVGSLVTA